MSADEHVNLIVVGGGAAGLAAAGAAERAGLSALLLEAQDRLGGRIATRPLESGGVFDEGAQMANRDMRAVLELARRAGLTLSRFRDAGRAVCVFGDRTASTEAFMSMDDVHERLRRGGSPLARLRRVGSAVRSALGGRPARPESLADTLADLSLSPEETALAASILTELFGRAPEALDAWAVRDVDGRYASERSDMEFQIVEGMGRIVEALAGELQRPPVLGEPVLRVEETADGVVVQTAKRRLSCDYAVLAVPPPAARRIDLVAARAEELDGLLGSFVSGDMIKTVLVYRRAFWRAEGLSGHAAFADPAGLVVVDASLDGDGPPRLVAFQGGPAARAAAALDAGTRRDRLLAHLARAFGEEAAAPAETAEAVWVDHPWCGGGYNASVRLGGASDAVARLAAWSGRLRFAGAEFDDRFWGHVEGAIGSGRAAVARIVAEAKHQAA
ncbi:MAG: FAD-dependent oxidoreductase [Pseudomonadota bacterium]